nr:MAG TPA: hypothetical protein [Caudoviricetes sp.]
MYLLIHQKQDQEFKREWRNPSLFSLRRKKDVIEYKK